jgi:type VI secretion system secreted protein Hcp
VALNAHLRLVGQKSGKIQGSVTQKGREGTSAVIAVSHEIVSPRDPVTGMATGKRQHEPLMVTKELDRASPALRQVLATNEALTTVDLLFYRPDRTMGTEVQYFTIRLTNAAIASIDMQMPNNKHADLAALETFEDVTFTYQKIEWTWVETATTVVDDWMSPVA